MLAAFGINCVCFGRSCWQAIWGLLSGCSLWHFGQGMHVCWVPHLIGCARVAPIMILCAWARKGQQIGVSDGRMIYLARVFTLVMLFVVFLLKLKVMLDLGNGSGFNGRQSARCSFILCSGHFGPLISFRNWSFWTSTGDFLLLICLLSLWIWHLIFLWVNSGRSLHQCWW